MKAPRSTRTRAFLLTIAVVASGCGESNNSGGSDAGVQVDSHVDARAQRGPLARLYANNPVTDNKTLVEVTLRHITDPDGKLKGRFVDAFNCLNEAGGEKIDINLGGFAVKGRLCKLAKTVFPGPDGSYLHIKPPAMDSDPDDPFSELMMYHHVTTIHDYFKAGLSVTHMDRPLRAIVNLQAYIDLLGRWMGLVNAAYVPKESAGVFKQLGVNLLNDEDAIMFIQGDNVDTAYDASVIYHEYTHAVIGSALQSATPDKYGTDPTPPGLNEGLADYFAASRLGNAWIGSYALSAVGATRDLTRNFKCPEHIVGESHQDGEIAAGALWAMRELLGQEMADKAIMKAVLGFTPRTTFEEAAKAILDEVKTVASDKEVAVKTLFEQRGLLGCVRLVNHEDYDNSGGRVLSPGYPADSGLYEHGTAEYLQHRLQVAATTKEIVIEYVAAGNSGAAGQPGTPGDIRIALHRGADPIIYTYDKKPVSSTAHAVLEGDPSIGGAGKLVITGSCVGPGPLVFQLLNKGAAPGQITKIKVTQSNVVTQAVPNFEHCK